MMILIPFKPVVLVLGLLTGLIFVGFVGSSLLEGKEPFVMDRGQARHALVKQDAARPSSESSFSASPVESLLSAEEKTRSPAIQKLLTRTSCK